MGEVTPNTDLYGFDPFAQHPFYAGINHSLVQRALARLDAVQPTGERIRIVDLASGAGAVTQLIVDELERLGRPATVLGIELSHEALELARKRLQGRAVQFIHGDADQLTHSIPDVDLVCLCNAVHLIPEKADAVRKVASALTPDGYFACNTTFFTGAQTPEGGAFRPSVDTPGVWLASAASSRSPPESPRPRCASRLVVCRRVRRSAGDPGLAGA